MRALADGRSSSSGVCPGAFDMRGGKQGACAHRTGRGAHTAVAISQPVMSRSWCVSDDVSATICLLLGHAEPASTRHKQKKQKYKKQGTHAVSLPLSEATLCVRYV